jgi:isocitrate/isopropylmalate dehydrogenase
MKQYRIAAIPGDGTGKEVIPEGLKALRVAAVQEELDLEIETFPWGAEHYLQTGEFMPADALTKLESFDAIYFGGVGHPDVDDSLPGKHCTFRVRKAFQQYVNLRPIRLLPGVQSPLGDKRAEDIDFVIIRENVEGEFAGIAGRGIANPLATIWSGALMLEHLGEGVAAQRILGSIMAVLQDKDGPRPVDLGGKATTIEIGDAVAQRLSQGGA